MIIYFDSLYIFWDKITNIKCKSSEIQNVSIEYDHIISRYVTLEFNDLPISND